MTPTPVISQSHRRIIHTNASTYRTAVAGVKRDDVLLQIEAVHALVVVVLHQLHTV